MLEEIRGKASIINPSVKTGCKQLFILLQFYSPSSSSNILISAETFMKNFAEFSNFDGFGFSFSEF